ncbi:MAG: cytochrome b/b6 domain-containing protein [Amylibacter sp.]|nr:cytochrome b/b6 domain-containing protein [Amylibacter sp.]
MSEQIKHARLTRMIHMGLALAVTLQMLGSLLIEIFEDTQTGKDILLYHQYIGLVAFVLILLFWLIVMIRNIGTDPALLFPWVAKARRAMIWAELKTHYATLKSRQIPSFDPHSPLAPAVHGLGLLLILAMAGSGTIYYFINTGDPDAGGLVGVVMFIHTTLANLVWVYLFAHAGFAVLHHYLKDMDLREMWSLKK